MSLFSLSLFFSFTLFHRPDVPFILILPLHARALLLTHFPMSLLLLIKSSSYPLPRSLNLPQSRPNTNPPLSLPLSRFPLYPSSYTSHPLPPPPPAFYPSTPLPLLLHSYPSAPPLYPSPSTSRPRKLKYTSISSLSDFANLFLYARLSGASIKCGRWRRTGEHLI